MRDALLLLVILSGLLAALRFPFAGILVWAWFSLMTPHQMAFGVFGLQLNLIIALVTILAIVINGEAFKFRIDAITGWLLAVMVWLFVSQANSLDPENSLEYFDRFTKTLLFAILCIQTATSRLRLHALIWVFVLSIGYFAAKGAVFTIVTLGEFRVQGVPNTILEDNNHMGIAIATTLPMILYLRSVAGNKWVRSALGALLLLSVFSIVGTQSRGAFISLVVFGGFFWWKSKNKAAIAAAMILLALPAILFMPSKWTERMSTITEAGEDDSFMGRVDAWIINTKFALERPLTGAGLRNPYQQELAEKVDPVRAPRAKAAHSIYFEMLGGAGFVGLFFYLMLLATAYFRSTALYRDCEKSALLSWKSRLGYYAQMSLVVFGIGGASTSLEMWDGYFVVIACIAAAARLPKVVGGRAETDRRASVGWRAAARGAPMPELTKPTPVQL
ncbi:MAG: putative O-glycosylation ligase, exosortase A system-associated [Parvularculaceae bacterium]|nr:putative O-glycosylation ligase, exosortase A system-associated [Parvularculaceae bacterium]